MANATNSARFTVLHQELQGTSLDMDGGTVIESVTESDAVEKAEPSA